MKRSHSLLASLAFGLSLVVSAPAFAVPLLQLDIAGGAYDGADETIVTSADSFTLYAYAAPTNAVSRLLTLGRTFYLSIALTPRANGAGDFGSFTVNGTTYDATADMTYGVPPIERNGTAGSDTGDLGRHGVYSTYFLQVPFTFSAANRSGEYDTATHAGQGPIAGNAMYYAAFAIDKSLLDDSRQLHFDVFSVRTRINGDRDIDRHAPFTHDAATVAGARSVGSPIPEPTAALVFGTALLVTRFSTRRGRFAR